MSLQPYVSPTRPFSASSPIRTPMALTPRSKVQAMLASLDDDQDQDSDKENQIFASSPHPGQTKHIRPSPPLTTHDYENIGMTTPPSPFPSSLQNENNEFDSDNDDDDVVASRSRKGTLASRMQTQTRRALSESDEDSDDGQAAYERVKMKILARKTQEQDSGPTAEGEPQHEKNENESLTVDQRQVESVGGVSKSLASQEDTSVASESPRQSSPSRASPGLFVSPERPLEPIEHHGADRESDADESQKEVGTAGNRLQALLARKRKEMAEKRQAAESDAEQDRDEDSDDSLSALQHPKESRTQIITAESETDEDREISKKLTQQARPTRKASKKALEEMNRETQRLSRNMQLTHEARTKTKFSVADFLAKFKQGQPTLSKSTKLDTAPAASSSSAPASPNAESAASPETTPSSPPSLGRTPEKVTDTSKGGLLVVPTETLPENNDTAASEDEQLPDLKTLLSQVATGVPKETYSSPRGNANLKDNTGKGTAKRYSAKRFAKSAKPVQAADNSDDDLEIVMTAQPSRLSIFDNLPASKARESGSIHALRALAQLRDTEKLRNRGKKSMTGAELDALNRRRAREQAKIERDEKIQKLRDKGVLVQTAEEKEQEQMQLENMLERARKEAEEIAKREKEAAKKEGKDDDDNFPDSDYEDEDYDGSDEEEEVVVQLSGSEDEAEGGDGLSDEEDELNSGSDDEETENAEAEPNSLVDNEAVDVSDEDESAEVEAEEAEGLDDGVDLTSDDELVEGPTTVKLARTNLRREKVVLSDGEDEVENELDASPKTKLPLPQATTPKQASSDAFGFALAKPAGLGLSQVFAGTMAESQTQVDVDMAFDSQQDSLAFLRGMPPPDLPDFTTPQTNDSPDVRIRDSQVDETPTHRRSQYSGPVHFDTQTQTAFSETLISEMPDPSQDVGFQVGDSQVAMIVPFSTMDTEPLADGLNEALEPNKRKGRLVRKSDAREVLEDESDVEDAEYGPADGLAPAANFFDVMRDAAKRPAVQDEFDKEKSEAKGMVEEQAEESEDEYAGLGGASDDESAGDADEDTKRMIDDEDNAVTNERDIAAYYAEKERLEDEKGIEKLYKDVINGGLRRKRGAQDDLWESDDEDEIVARRRLAKQREFAKMRKALLADEKLGKIAENPKQQAFLQTVEDRDDNDDFDFLDQPHDNVSQVTDSQSSAVRQPQPLSTISANTRKRRHSDSEEGFSASQEENRPPPNLRRAAKVTRPTSLADIRNTLSEIIGEPEAILESQFLTESPSHSADELEEDPDGDDEAEESDHEELYSRPSPKDMPPPLLPASQIAAGNSSPRNRRRTAPSAARSTVIDRMALKRSASSSANSNASSSDRLAFHASAKAAYSGFRVPSLLRRATTNSSTLSTSSTSTSASDASGGLGGNETVKMGGTKKSSVNYYVREKERRVKVEQVEKERQEGRERVGKMRRSVAAGGIGALTGGSFD